MRHTLNQLLLNLRDELGRAAGLLRTVEKTLIVAHNQAGRGRLSRGGRVFILVTLLSFGSLILLSALTVLGARPAVVPLAAREGKVVWQKSGCVECHSVFGNGGYSAPDLTGITDRRSPEWLRDFFQRRPPMSPSRAKRHPGLSRGETDSLIHFLRFIREVQPNWPPRSEGSPGR